MKVIDIKRMERHKAFIEKNISKAESRLFPLQDKMENGKPVNVLAPQHHENKRSFERCVSRSQIIEVITFGDIIEINYNSNNEMELLLMSFVKIAEQRYRPLHVKIILKDDNTIFVKTVYDPRTNDDLWQDNYSTRMFYL